MLKSLQNAVGAAARVCNGLAALCVVLMMLLTCADVILRFFRYPIPGTYEVVSLLGGLFVALALTQTSIENGHIAVDFFVRKASPRMRTVLEGFNHLICAPVFGIIAWQSCRHALDMKRVSQVSLTLQLPLHPFVLGIALGCGLLAVFLLLRALELFHSLFKSES